MPLDDESSAVDRLGCDALDALGVLLCVIIEDGAARVPPGAEVCETEWECKSSDAEALMSDSEEVRAVEVKVDLAAVAAERLGGKGAVELGGGGTERF